MNEARDGRDREAQWDALQARLLREVDERRADAVRTSEPDPSVVRDRVLQRIAEGAAAEPAERKSFGLLVWARFAAPVVVLVALLGLFTLRELRLRESVPPRAESSEAVEDLETPLPPASPTPESFEARGRADAPAQIESTQKLHRQTSTTKELADTAGGRDLDVERLLARLEAESELDAAATDSIRTLLETWIESAPEGPLRTRVERWLDTGQH